MYGISGREITKYTVVHGVYIYSSGQPLVYGHIQPYILTIMYIYIISGCVVKI